MKIKVIKEVKKYLRRKRNEQAQEFAKRRYDKTKEFKFPDKDQINMEKHFYFPKFVINDLVPNSRNPTSFLSNAALAVYPVICSRANFEEDTWIQLPQDHIAKMAGVSVNTAAKGIRELVSRTEKDLLERRKITEGTRHYYIYKVGFVRKQMMEEWKGEFFIFHTCIIDSGVWAELYPRAKALYLAMRSEAKFDPELYGFVEDIDLDGMELNDFYNIDGQYRNRKWDVCEVPLTVLCRMVGIDNSDISKVALQLEQYRLVEKVDSVYKVYLKPRIR